MTTGFRDTSEQDRPLPPQSRRRPLLIAAGLAALAALALLGGGRVRQMLSADSAVSAARLGIATVDVAPLTRDVAGEGRVVAAQSPTLFAPGAGTVTLAVQAGDPVRRGQVLARVDSPELANRLAQERSNADALRAELARAEVEARQQAAALQSAFDVARIDQQTAQNDLARQTQAFEAGATARMQVERAQDALAKARLALDQARDLRGLKTDSLKLDVQARQSALARQQLLVADLERQVAELQVRSPVDGQVGQLFIADRSNVARDARLLSVIDLSALEVQMQVAESFARELQPGMPGEITGNGQRWAGQVSSVSPEVVNGEVAARLRFAGAQPGQLRQNQRLSVRVLLDRRDKVLGVARGSFVDEGGGGYAYVVRGGYAEKVAVKLGARSLERVEVLSGLSAGDRVVISGSDNFKGAERALVAD
ncbi:efflux RND transporter periplasmic adaptor subunit [Pelomonas aquatica]|uniref:HlyD family efflux transporter periplasmic adaptor subunit n=1 Tax=Pelomonas aquatica TaxID=431058 RepID=A0A9X4LJ28_9BURK|nr:HlyD family efflux transporter periplasmic adaptor subunit [Pelomonas aquatica]MCY4756065.1 HlyD family efflux transporter periplasmic adaptor subunit [Pelomonas aquatica]MDG0864123.1 HlyD family efflux transporter periplasmic adaptor subunit [Pelomonas aquatica]